ncbi:MAG: thioredoxin-disulfide reductase [Candidatus Babeliaceae bacterium]|jgi:thioredoxin reductase (NADPH)
MKTTENLIIIGSGPAALTAAIYASRSALSPIIIEGQNPGGQLMGTSFVENWPGNVKIYGPELMNNLRQHATAFGTRFVAGMVTNVHFEKNMHTLTLHNGSTYTTKALIIATGATPKRLGCLGEAEYWGRGVTTCAVCDGAFYKDKPVLIIGGGDTALEDASFMTNYTNDITIVHILDQLTGSHAMQQRVLNNPAIKIIYSSTVTGFEGDGNHVTHALITDKKTNTTNKHAFSAAFVAIGLQPNTGIFKDKLELDKYGYIIHKEHTQTSVSGVFAAGDVVDYRYRQAITSAGSGCMAALDAERYLKSQE